jgi:hypothetical protein
MRENETVRSRRGGARRHAPRPERDLLHVQRGDSAKAEAHRYRADLDRFEEIARADAGNLSVTRWPKNARLRMVYTEWLHAGASECDGIIVCSAVPTWLATNATRWLDVETRRKIRSPSTVDRPLRATVKRITIYPMSNRRPTARLRDFLVIPPSHKASGKPGAPDTAQTAAAYRRLLVEAYAEREVDSREIRRRRRRAKARERA